MGLDRAKHEEHEGLINDDRFAKGVQNLCRFYSALLQLNVVDAVSGADSAEIAHFAFCNVKRYHMFASAQVSPNSMAPF
ncbi:hypothetical protein BGY98DRAFT_922736 [Russula aff. rugulosa BPL654]|nr:hypothetical protein BGY98DRAFT_922736 [Russula aff. rugulosa BPL654]